MNHTPGPWKADKRVGCVAVYPANTPDEQSYCLDGAQLWAIHFKQGIWKGNSWQLEPEVEANAKLIAAAPDLLRFCEMVVGNFTDGHHKPLKAASKGGQANLTNAEIARLVERARAAIAKAT